MAANRICKVLKVNQDNERLMEEYERLASDVSLMIFFLKTKHSQDKWLQGLVNLAKIHKRCFVNKTILQFDEFFIFL